MNIHDRWEDTTAFITHDPTREDTRPFHEVYGHRCDRAGLILTRAYALARAGHWDRMRAYLHWELDQPVYGDPAMGEVQKLRRAVQHADDPTRFIYAHMVSARLRHQSGHPDKALARVGWLLELIPDTHHLRPEVAEIYRKLTALEDQ